MQDIPSKVTGSTHFATEFNSYVGEDKNLVTDVGIALNSSDSHQLGQSSAAYATTGNYFVDSGAVNALVLASSQFNFQTPQLYYDGMIVRTRPAFTNTGPSTINVAGLGNKFIKLSGGVLDVPSGAIIQGVMTGFYYDAANDVMIYIPPTESLSGHPYNYFSGLATSDDGVSIMTFFQGQCATADNEQLITNPSTFTKDYSAVWAAGTGNGGRPSAVTLLANTQYHDFIISKPDGTVDFGLDTSLIAANLLADAAGDGFTRYRRVRSHFTKSASTDINPMINVGNYFTYLTTIRDFNYTGNGSATTNVALTIPNDIPLIARNVSTLSGRSNNAATFGNSWIFDTNGNDTTNNDRTLSLQIGQSNTLLNASGSSHTETTTSDGTINATYNMTGFNITSYSVYTIGWIDYRGVV